MGGITLSEPLLEETSRLFLALSDPTRIKILRSLLESPGPLNLGDVAKAVGLAQANASRHLALLVGVGLATREARGNEVFFAPVMPLVGAVCELVCNHVRERTREAFLALQ